MPILCGLCTEWCDCEDGKEWRIMILLLTALCDLVWFPGSLFVVGTSITQKIFVHCTTGGQPMWPFWLVQFSDVNSIKRFDKRKMKVYHAIIWVMSLKTGTRWSLKLLFFLPHVNKFIIIGLDTVSQTKLSQLEIKHSFRNDLRVEGAGKGGGREAYLLVRSMIHELCPSNLSIS